MYTGQLYSKATLQFNVKFSETFSCYHIKKAKVNTMMHYYTRYIQVSCI